MERYDECLHDLQETLEIDPGEAAWNWIPVGEIPNCPKSFQQGMLDLLETAVNHPKSDKASCSKYLERLRHELDVANNSGDDETTESPSQETDERQ